MNTPRDPSDPLLHSLTEETADLPARAALEARRQTAQRRKTRRRFAHAAIVAMVAIVTWKSLPHRDPDVRPPDITLTNLPATNPPANAERLLPTGLNEDQQRFIESAPDLPMLLVRDESGKVTRIHIVER